MTTIIAKNMLNQKNRKTNVNRRITPPSEESPTPLATAAPGDGLEAAAAVELATLAALEDGEDVTAAVLLTIADESVAIVVVMPASLLEVVLETPATELESVAVVAAESVIVSALEMPVVCGVNILLSVLMKPKSDAQSGSFLTNLAMQLN